MSIDDKKKLEALVIKAKEGESEASVAAKVEILNIFKGIIVYISKKYFIKNYDIDDLISEGHNVLLNAIIRYKKENNCFYTYAYRSIENRFIDLLRKSKEGRPLNDLYITEELQDYIVSDEAPLEDKVYYKYLRKKIENLPKEERDIIKKVYFKGQTLTEIAKESGLSYTRVQYIRNRGLNTLKEII